MKQLLLLITFLVSTTGLFAQMYQLQTTTGIYQDIANPIYEIPDTSVYFGNVTTKPEMNFTAFGKPYALNDNVFIPLKQGYAYFINNTRSTTVYGCKGNFTGRHGNGQTSVFSFATYGVSPDITFVMQWKNMGIENGDSSDYVNFQIWLNEKTREIEVRFGECHVKPGLWESLGNGPTIGMLEMDDEFTTIYNQLWLSGNASSPVLNTSSTFVQLNDVPTNGAIYKFLPLTTGIKEDVSKSSFGMFPNPVSDLLMINTPDQVSEIHIYDHLGKEVLYIKDHSRTEPLEIAMLKEGMYFLQAGQSPLQKFIVQK